MDNDVVVNTKARTTEKFTKSYITTDGNLDKLVDDVFEGIWKEVCFVIYAN